MVIGVSVVMLILGSCDSSEDPLFELVSPEESGISFTNTLIADETQNLYDYEYFFNGGGVGIIDVNNDGLQDVFLGGNTVSSKLFLNQGNMKFRDITLEAGVTTDRWITGIAVVDINNDGYQDLYLSVGGNQRVDLTANLFFENNGDLTFTEVAAKYGIADTSLSTQSVFLDYDLDGDQDLYVMNFGNIRWAKERLYEKIRDGSGPGRDKFYKNNGDGSFSDITTAAGIGIEGYGLGISILDVNQDNYPDIYVANDYLDDDALYVNTRDGGFRDELSKYVKHTSYFAMGCDVADINNDGLEDIFVLDMLPEDQVRHKTLMGNFGYDKVSKRLESGYVPALTRNVLQLNQGNGQFSEVGRMCGLSATDWSWAPLIADFDNDGNRDIFITNGYKKEVSNMDIQLTINFSSPYQVSKETKAAADAMQREKFLQMVNDLPEQRISNYAFRNEGNLAFTKTSEEWGLDEPSLSNGAAYADLDNDGDLDLVVNNVDDPVFLYRNTSNSKEGYNHYLRIELQQGQSAKIRIYYGSGQQQYGYYNPYRGYQSSVEPYIHFGLGASEMVDSLVVTWSDGSCSILLGVPANQALKLSQDLLEAINGRPLSNNLGKPIFQLSDSLISFHHVEDDFIDLKHNPLLPHSLSRGGPALVTGDINGDDRDDLIVGGSKAQSTFIFLQTDGGFSMREIVKPFPFEDMGMALLDFDGDQDLDLYVASGGCESFTGSLDYFDRLYENDGMGNFSLTSGVIPGIKTSTSEVVAADFDRDGDVDLFVGGWVIPDNYPQSAPSYLLENEGGTFVIKSRVIGLGESGLVKSAVWTDIDQDDWPDLLVVGEWMPIKVFKNFEGDLVDFTDQYNLSDKTGWWNSILPGDFDNDGDMDYILGNQGLNSRYKASNDRPMTIVSTDIDHNGLRDPIIFCYQGEKEYPIHDRDVLLSRVVSLKKKFQTYRAYASAEKEEIIPKSMESEAYSLTVSTLESCLLRNDQESFGLVPLPMLAQSAPLYGSLAFDVNSDPYLDVILIGNNHHTAVSEGPYDAINGIVLTGNGDGTFNVDRKSGLSVSGDGRALSALIQNESIKIIASQNNGALQVFDFPSASYRKFGDDDRFANIYFDNGVRRRVELQQKGGYMAQYANFLMVPEAARNVTIENYYEDLSEIQ